MSVNARVQKHRHALRATQCRRLEVWLAAGLIEAARSIAKAEGQPVWEFVQDALTAYVTHHPALIKDVVCLPLQPAE